MGRSRIACHSQQLGQWRHQIRGRRLRYVQHNRYGQAHSSTYLTLGRVIWKVLTSLSTLVKLRKSMISQVDKLRSRSSCGPFTVSSFLPVRAAQWLPETMSQYRSGQARTIHFDCKAGAKGSGPGKPRASTRQHLATLVSGIVCQRLGLGVNQDARCNIALRNSLSDGFFRPLIGQGSAHIAR